MCYSFHYSVGSLPIEVDKSIPDNIGSPNEPPLPLPPKANDDSFIPDGTPPTTSPPSPLPNKSDL